MSPADTEFTLLEVESNHAKAILNLQLTSCSSQLQDLNLFTILNKPVMLHHAGLTNSYFSNTILKIYFYTIIFGEQLF